MKKTVLTSGLIATFLEPLPVGLIIAFVSAGVLGRRRRAAASTATVAAA